MNAISGGGAPPERRLIRDFDLVDQISRMRLVINNGSVGLGVSEPFVSGLEIMEVMFGPFDLNPDPSEVGLADYDCYA